MKLNKSYLIPVTIFLVFVISCSSQPNMEVKYHGEVCFRKTYANIQFIENEKETEYYLSQQEKSNPQICDVFTYADSVLYNNFLKFPFVKSGEFIMSRFIAQTSDTATFIDHYNKKFMVRFYSGPESLTHFKIYSFNDSIDINTGSTNLQNLDYTFLDIIPGGNNELIFLDDYYIMNGDNYNLKVYEIVTRE